MSHDENAALIRAVTDELDKQAWIDRAHRLLRERGLCGAREGTAVKVNIELDIEVVHGHPAQVLAVLHERLPELVLRSEKDGLLATVTHVHRLEIG